MMVEQERREILDKLLKRYCNDCGRGLKVELTYNVTTQVHRRILGCPTRLMFGKVVEKEVCDTSSPHIRLVHKCKATGMNEAAPVESYMTTDQCKEIYCMLGELQERVG
jgi:hypothetical protein